MNGGADQAQAATEAEVSAHLERLLASEAFAKSATNRRLLSYLVQRHGQGPDGPKEAEIAIDVFGRDASFHGGDDSVVRVAMRGLRQKLLEYYAGQGKDDRLVFDVPKGSYRLKVSATADAAPADLILQEGGALPPVIAPRRRPLAGILAAALAALLLGSVALNLFLWQQRDEIDGGLREVRQSLLWRDIAASNRPVMFVLGDLFMYTQTDPVTGRVQTVRDPQITSSEDLREFLATHPSLASVRGLRYASYLQKSTALALATVIPVVSRPGRRIEIRLRDELRAEDIGSHDIVYVGPLERMGPLDSIVQQTSRYRFDATSSGVADVPSGKVYRPEGELSSHRKDYALVSSLHGAQGNRIVILTAGGRNAGLGQVVRAVTTREGLSALDEKLRSSGVAPDSAFEVLMSVAGYRQTDLSAEVVGARRL
jgi:hypothetical protein